MTRARVIMLALAVVALTVWTWPHDAIPSLRTACDSCVSLGGGSPNGPAGPVFTDSGTARFFRHIAPAYAFAYFALSPFGYLTLLGVRWLADRLHRART